MVNPTLISNFKDYPLSSKFTNCKIDIGQPNLKKFQFEERGFVELKGMGQVASYLLLEEATTLDSSLKVWDEFGFSFPYRCFSIAIRIADLSVAIHRFQDYSAH